MQCVNRNGTMPCQTKKKPASDGSLNALAEQPCPRGPKTLPDENTSTARLLPQRRQAEAEQSDRIVWNEFWGSPNWQMYWNTTIGKLPSVSHVTPKRPTAWLCTPTTQLWDESQFSSRVTNWFWGVSHYFCSRMFPGGGVVGAQMFCSKYSGFPFWELLQSQVRMSHCHPMWFRCSTFWRFYFWLLRYAHQKLKPKTYRNMTLIIGKFSLKGKKTQTVLHYSHISCCAQAKAMSNIQIVLWRHLVAYWR